MTQGCPCGLRPVYTGGVWAVFFSHPSHACLAEQTFFFLQTRPHHTNNVWHCLYWNIVMCNKTEFIACRETTRLGCFVSVTENEGMIPVGHPASLLYPGSVCWKVWMHQTSLNKQISPEGKYEEYRQTSAPWHEQWAPIAALKDGLFCAETAAPTWCMINVVMPHLFSSREAFLS